MQEWRHNYQSPFNML